MQKRLEPICTNCTFAEVTVAARVRSREAELKFGPTYGGVTTQTSTEPVPTSEVPVPSLGAMIPIGYAMDPLEMDRPGRVDYTVQIWKEGAQFVAHAMPLDVMSCGRTADEARQAVSEAVRLFLATANEIGTLEMVLEESGYARKGGDWLAPDFVAVERHSELWPA